jgi:hypothetical protein
LRAIMTNQRCIMGHGEQLTARDASSGSFASLGALRRAREFDR